MPPNSKTKGTKQLQKPPIQSTPSEPPLSFSSYPSIVGVHASLLAFSALFVPQSKSYLELATQLPGAIEFTSQDHPQHPFLLPITVNPTLTLSTLCASSVLLQSWWAGWLKAWHMNSIMQGNEEDIRLNKAILRKSKAYGLLKAWAAVLFSSGIFHVVFVLFGAPITSHVIKTYLLALLLSILVVFPPAYVLGTPSLTSSSTQALVVRLTWTRIYAEMSSVPIPY
jgi:phosphatidylinositol glycan class F